MLPIINRKFKRILNFLILLTVIFISQPAFAIKIGLLNNADYVGIAVSQPGTVINAYNNKAVLNILPMKIYVLKPSSSGMVISHNGKSMSINSNYITVKVSNGGFLLAKNRWYRGEFILYRNSNGITVINNLDIESYLMGVVPSEMPSSWNYEALKAQAIAARSYAVANLGKRARYGYDLNDTPADQAYMGASRETAKTDKAVIDTKGQVLVCGNKVIPAYYHSSSGGHTINSGAVWFKDLPFVKPVPSYDGNLPKNGHGVGMSQHGANNLANWGYDAYQILGYFFQNVKLYLLNANI